MSFDDARKSAERYTALKFKTKSDLSSVTRADVILCLNCFLACSLDLQSRAKQAHWNVKGMSFGPLHKLFDKLSDSLFDYSDSLAERVVQLGGVADGTVKAAAAKSTLVAYPPGLSAGEDHLEALSNNVAAFNKEVRKAAADFFETDANTADLLTSISSGLDKWLWFLEAHLQKKSQ